MRREAFRLYSRREESRRWGSRRVLAVRGRRACVLLAILTLPVAVHASAASTMLYVDQKDASCSDTGSGSGTAGQPYCTIGAAASKATAGMTVQVSAGTYNEQVSPRSGAANAPVTFAADPGETVTVRGGKYGFYISNKKWVTVRGFVVTETVNNGFHVSTGASYVKIVGNQVSYAGKPVSGATAKGISVTDSNDSVIEDNTIEHNSNFGVYLSNSARNQIVGNEVASNAKVYSRAASGIRLHSSDTNTVADNVSHDNEDSGIEVVTGSDNNLVVNNVGYDNGDHGIDLLGATGQRVVSNSIYNNLTAGINVEGVSTGTTLANNISVDNGINSPRTTGNIRVDSDSTSGTTVDYDVVHLRSAGTLIVWATTAYSSLEAFKAATGQESRGIEADPLWTSPASGDLRLAPGSPAVDSAAAGTSGHPTMDADGNGRVDYPAAPNTGTGPRSYDDRGAYELQLRDASPAAELAVTPASGLVDLDVTADASGSTDDDGRSPIASYTFDFGDGSAVVGPQPGATAPHTFTAAGTHTVTVTVTDTAGLSSTATRDVTVTDDPPVAALTATPSSGSAPLNVTADASGSTDTDGTPIESYTFDFGDGSAVVGPQPGATAAHIYTGGGTFTITVTVTDEGGRSSKATAQVTTSFGADDPPAAVLTVTPASGLVDLDVTADASGSTDDDVLSPIASYTFDFGDGSAVVGPQPGATAPHTFTAAGTHTVTVTVTDTAGLSSSTTRDVTVTDDPPVAVLTATPASGAAPLDVTADASGSTDTDGTPVESYTFDFGDGSAVVGPQPGATAAHTYTRGGTFTVTVTVTDTAGLSSTATTQVAVQPNSVLNAGFETGLSGWNTSGSGANISLTRVGGGHSGDWAAKLTNTGTTTSTCTLNDSPNSVPSTAAGTYNGTVWARADLPGAILRLRLREYSGSTLVGSATTLATLTTSWQRVTVAYTSASPGSSTLDYNAYVTGASPGACFYADDASIYRG